MTEHHEHQVEIDSVIPGPETILLEGTVDNVGVTSELTTTITLAHLHMTLEEFRASAWSEAAEAPEFQHWLSEMLAYSYHRVLAEEGSLGRAP